MRRFITFTLTGTLMVAGLPAVGVTDQTGVRSAVVADSPCQLTTGQPSGLTACPCPGKLSGVAVNSAAGAAACS
ncbi:MAG: hypothetical protein KDN05_17770 [Verrucomicrobiae bacterium]|nr:hypothetical protein [Verrucomicrobiae bacterium]